MKLTYSLTECDLHAVTGRTPVFRWGYDTFYINNKKNLKKYISTNKSKMFNKKTILSTFT